MKPAKITAGKGLTMRLLAVSEGGDEHETSQCHGRQRVNHMVACCVGVEVGGGGDEHEASLHHGRQRVNDVVAVSGVVTAGKGLIMWLLLCQWWGSRQANG